MLRLGGSGSLGPLLRVGCAASAGPNLWVSAVVLARPGPLIPPAIPVIRPSIGSQAGLQTMCAIESNLTKATIIYSNPALALPLTYIMNTDFMHDTEYVEICGNKTVIELISALAGIFDKHDIR